jgi:hypothetical protein
MSKSYHAATVVVLGGAKTITKGLPAGNIHEANPAPLLYTTMHLLDL